MLLECLTQRLRGHYEGDPAAYREAIAADEWQRVDPILRWQRHAIAHGWLDESGAEAIEREAAEAVEAAVAFAESSDFPPADLAERLVYAGPA
jgi:pyruvate dehydrogenase E1 component alpha subunit